MKSALIVSALVASFWTVVAWLIASAASGKPGVIIAATVITFGLVFLVGLFAMSLCVAAGRVDHAQSMESIARKGDE